MIRRLSLVRKRSELSREEFLERWTGEHVEIARRLPGLRGYVIHVLDGDEPPYDGIAITTFDSREDAERAFADPELHVELSDDEIQARLATVEHPPPRYPTGVLAKYARLVGSAATGARVGA
jgi:uncharacterized protein (TIGR02118 family)